MHRLTVLLARITLAALPLYGIRFAIGPLPSTILEVLIVATVVVWGIELIAKKESPVLPKTPLLILAGTLLGAATLGVFIAPDTRAALGIWRAYFIEPFAFFLVVHDLVRSRHLTKDSILQSFSVPAIGIALYAIIQRITGIGIPEPWVAERRVTSVFSYPNAIGLFLAPIIPLFLSQVSKQSFLRTTFYVLTTACSLIAIIFAHSTGALVGVVGGVGIGFLIYFTSKKQWARLALCIGLAALVGMILFANTTIKNELLLRDWSGTVRKIGWRESLAMLTDTKTPLGIGRPLLGAGLSGFKTVVAPYHTATAIEIFQYPHNLVLNFWTETGLLGVVSILGLAAYFFVTASKKTPFTYHTLGAIAAMIAILIHGLVDVPYFKNDLAVVFWMMFIFLL